MANRFRRRIVKLKPTDGDLLRDQIYQCELTLTQAARAIGISRASMSRYCNGNVPVPRLVKLALSGYIATLEACAPIDNEGDAAQCDGNLAGMPRQP